MVPKTWLTGTIAISPYVPTGVKRSPEKIPARLKGESRPSTPANANRDRGQTNGTRDIRMGSRPRTLSVRMPRDASPSSHLVFKLSISVGLVRGGDGQIPFGFRCMSELNEQEDVRC